MKFPFFIPKRLVYETWKQPDIATAPKAKEVKNAIKQRIENFQVEGMLSPEHKIKVIHDELDKIGKISEKLKLQVENRLKSYLVAKTIVSEADFKNIDTRKKKLNVWLNKHFDTLESGLDAASLSAIREFDMAMDTVMEQVQTRKNFAAALEKIKHPAFTDTRKTEVVGLFGKMLEKNGLENKSLTEIQSPAEHQKYNETVHHFMKFVEMFNETVLANCLNTDRTKLPDSRNMLLSTNSVAYKLADGNIMFYKYWSEIDGDTPILYSIDNVHGRVLKCDPRVMAEGGKPAWVYVDIDKKNLNATTENRTKWGEYFDQRSHGIFGSDMKPTAIHKARMPQKSEVNEAQLTQMLKNLEQVSQFISTGALNYTQLNNGDVKYIARLQQNYFNTAHRLDRAKFFADNPIDYVRKGYQSPVKLMGEALLNAAPDFAGSLPQRTEALRGFKEFAELLEKPEEIKLPWGPFRLEKGKKVFLKKIPEKAETAVVKLNGKYSKIEPDLAALKNGILRLDGTNGKVNFYKGDKLEILVKNKKYIFDIQEAASAASNVFQKNEPLSNTGSLKGTGSKTENPKTGLPATAFAVFEQMSHGMTYTVISDQIKIASVVTSGIQVDLDPDTGALYVVNGTLPIGKEIKIPVSLSVGTPTATKVFEVTVTLSERISPTQDDLVPTEGGKSRQLRRGEIAPTAGNELIMSFKILEDDLNDRKITRKVTSVKTRDSAGTLSDGPANTVEVVGNDLVVKQSQKLEADKIYQVTVQAEQTLSDGTKRPGVSEQVFEFATGKVFESTEIQAPSIVKKFEIEKFETTNEYKLAELDPIQEGVKERKITDPAGFEIGGNDLYFKSSVGSAPDILEIFKTSRDLKLEITSVTGSLQTVQLNNFLPQKKDLSWSDLQVQDRFEFDTFKQIDIGKGRPGIERKIEPTSASGLTLALDDKTGKITATGLWDNKPFQVKITAMDLLDSNKTIQKTIEVKQPLKPREPTSEDLLFTNGLDRIVVNRGEIGGPDAAKMVLGELAPADLICERKYEKGRIFRDGKEVPVTPGSVIPIYLDPKTNQIVFYGNTSAPWYVLKEGDVLFLDFELKIGAKTKIETIQILIQSPDKSDLPKTALLTKLDTETLTEVSEMAEHAFKNKEAVRIIALNENTWNLANSDQISTIRRIDGQYQLLDKEGTLSVDAQHRHLLFYAAMKLNDLVEEYKYPPVVVFEKKSDNSVEVKDGRTAKLVIEHFPEKVNIDLFLKILNQRIDDAKKTETYVNLPEVYKGDDQRTFVHNFATPKPFKIEEFQNNYFYQYSLDKGKTWIHVDQKSKGNFSISKEDFKKTGTLTVLLSASCNNTDLSSTNLKPAMVELEFTDEFDPALAIVEDKKITLKNNRGTRDNMEIPLVVEGLKSPFDSFVFVQDATDKSKISVRTKPSVTASFSTVGAEFSINLKTGEMSSFSPKFSDRFDPKIDITDDLNPKFIARPKGGFDKFTVASDNLSATLSNTSDSWRSGNLNLKLERGDIAGGNIGLYVTDLSIIVPHKKIRMAWKDASSAWHDIYIFEINSEGNLITTGRFPSALDYTHTATIKHDVVNELVISVTKNP